MSNVRFVQVDAFTNQPFRGNPAAVCFLDQPADADWMQAVAIEMNLSETAFVRPLNEGFELRWFTPAAEVDLCGHATLAAAHALWTEGAVKPADAIPFHTRSGLLTCTLSNELIQLDFPATPPTEVTASEELLDALGLVEPPQFTGVSNQADKIIVVSSESVVRALQPDFNKLLNLTARGFMVTALADDDDIDFASRFFAPAHGINEDPVTGSAHCCMGPYWANRLGKVDMIAHQISKRLGILQISVAGDRVLLRGQAVTTVRGELV